MWACENMSWKDEVKGDAPLPEWLVPPLSAPDMRSKGKSVLLLHACLCSVLVHVCTLYCCCCCYLMLTLEPIFFGLLVWTKDPATLQESFKPSLP